MSRLIDGDELMEMLTTAIRNMKGVARFLDAENDPEIQMEIKAYTDIANGVKDMPTIEPERKTGKWLPDNNNYIEERFICSVCGKSYKVDTCMGKPMWDFCPCGAKMEEGDRT